MPLTEGDHFVWDGGEAVSDERAVAQRRITEMTTWAILRAFRVRARDVGALGYSPQARLMHQQYRRRQLARRRARRAGAR